MNFHDSLAMTAEISDILRKISKISPHFVSGELPRPFIGKNVKAILVGADPGTSNEERFTHVFKLEDGIESEYFKQFLPSLRAVNLSLEDLYVQNVCRNYFDCDTLSHKKDWLRCAEYWIEPLKEELDEFDPQKALPVLVSAFVILVALCRMPCENPEFYYTNRVFVRKNQNRLDRTLIPFFRGGAGKYLLTKLKWNQFTKKITSYVA